MGLFGYNEKDYNKNTGILANRMTALADNVPWGDVKRLLNAVILQIGTYPYTKTDGKAQKAIDDRIAALIQTMTDDFQQGKQSRCLEHGTMLLSAVVDSRRFGKERYDAQDLATKEKMAQCGGELKDALDKATAIEKKMAEVKRQAMKLQPGTAEYKKLGADYTRLQTQYNLALQAANRLEKQFKNLEQELKLNETDETTKIIASIGVTPAKDLAKRAAKTAEDLGKEQANNEAYDEIGSDIDEALGGVTSNSGLGDALGAALESDRQKAAYDSIQGSTPDPFGFGSSSADANDDPFTDPFGDAR